MARLSASFMLFGLLSASLVAASPYNQEEQNRNADCDNGCFFSSFPGGSCTNDAACMCTQQKYREAYFCCMAEKCAASVLPDSIQRQTSECAARNMEFTFDEEKVCGIKPATVSSTVEETATSTATDDSSKASATSASSVVLVTGTTTEASIPGTTSKATTLDTTAKGSTPGTTTEAATADTTTEATATGTPAVLSTGSSTPTSNSASQTRVIFNGVAILVVASVMMLW